MPLRRPNPVSRLALLAIACVCVGLLPATGHGWGTLTGGSNLSPKERADLQKLLDDYGVPPKITAADLDKRLGAHPIHQLIAYEAALMLARDPATRDGASGFPTPEAINGWDGVDRCEQGIRQRGGSGLVPESALAPPVVSGPSPDAELTLGDGGVLGWNSRYAVRAHYWNPWLDSGDAPTAAGAMYSRLSARLIVARGDAAQAAAYLAHYVSDALSAKHADAVMLTLDDVAKLDAIGDRWLAARTSLTDWLASPILQEAVAVIEARARAHPDGDRWLARVRAHIALAAGSTTLARADGFIMTIAPSTLSTAVACFLHDLRARPDDKSVDAFYTYFDPFYFNGPIFHPLGANPSFQLCSPLSEHMQWETAPAQAELAHTTLAAQAGVPFDKRTPLLPGPVRNHYVVWAPTPGFEALERGVVGPAYRATMAELLRACSRRVHGDIGAAKDFASDFRPALDAAIGCVFSAFRASVTGLRGEAFARRVGSVGHVNIQLRLTNLADRPATLVAARVGYQDGGKHTTRPGWDVALSDVVAADDGGATDVALTIDGMPDGLALEDVYVDVRARVADTPDRGWLRVPLQRQRFTMRGPGNADEVPLAPNAPTDIVVVFDTTSSMQSSIDALARDTVSSIRALRDKTDDLRLAVVTFRDLAEEEDRAHFQVRPFTRDLDAQFAFITSLRAGGGGDTPEDLLEGVSRAIALWEAEGADDDRVPAKIVIVVTDAPGKSPDVNGNTFESIARRAREVDPAHVYSIVVGDNAEAMTFAERLAALTEARALRAATGDEVAKVLAVAAIAAIRVHADEARASGGPRWALVGPGIGAVLAGIGCLALGLRRARASRQNASTTG